MLTYLVVNLIQQDVGNRNNVDKCGVMIYQSMSGDADVGKGSFESYNSSLTIIKSTILNTY